MTTAVPEFLALTGPTASGKTDLSIAVGEQMPIEIISMDSRQVYRSMDIGTDKVCAADRERVPHHGLDLVTPGERYSAGRFAREARVWIKEIHERSRVPVLAGGTGFFLRAILDPIFSEPPLDPERLKELRAWLRLQSRDLLERWVAHLDPHRAPLAIEGGPQRMGRTIEVALLSGQTLSWWHKASVPEASGLQGLVILLGLQRSEMDERIEDRVCRMIERGLLEEVQGLVDAGYGDEAPGMTGTGYREIAAYIRGEQSLDQAVEEIRRNTRRYSRRQLTWFRNQLPDSTIHVDATLPLQEQVDLVMAAWNAAGGSRANGS